MRLKYLPDVSACVLALLAPLAAANAPEQVFMHVAPAVVVLDIANADGTAIEQSSGVVTGAGQVLTSCQVVRKDKNLQVRHSGNTFKATLQHTDLERDLCQLRVPRLQSQSATLGTTQRLRVGQRVYAVGAPTGQELVLSEGLITSLRPHEGAQYIHTSAAISLSSRGGGLFDDQGRLLGITTSQVIEGRNFNFALPVEWIGELPQRAKAAPGAAKKGGLDRLNRSIALEKRGSWQGLLKLSQQWVKSEPRSTVAWFSLGAAHAGLKQYDQAIRAYRESLRIQPEYADAWYNLGVAYANLKQHAQAMHAYREALHIQPEGAEAWRNLGTAYGGVKQHDQAVHADREPLRLQPEFADAWYSLGNAYYDLKQYDQAIQAYRESLRLRPGNANTWYNLGTAYDEIKQYEQAIQAYQEALRIQPQYAMAWYDLGRAYYFQGERDKVREIYQTLRKLDPARADKYFNALILP